jgi:hypothetical protein
MPENIRDPCSPNANFSVAARELGRLKLAASDTAGAVRTWRSYLKPRGRAEPSQRKLDDQTRAKLVDIGRKTG